MKEIRRLAEFLGVDPSVADTVAEKTNFSVMKKLKVKTDMPDIAQLFDDNKANANFYRKGEYDAFGRLTARKVYLTTQNNNNNNN